MDELGKLGLEMVWVVCQLNHFATCKMAGELIVVIVTVNSRSIAVQMVQSATTYDGNVPDKG